MSTQRSHRALLSLCSGLAVTLAGCTTDGGAGQSPTPTEPQPETDEAATEAPIRQETTIDLHWASFGPDQREHILPLMYDELSADK